MRRHYLNLSNGLEALAQVRASGETFVFSRIQSTTIERKDWWSLFVVDLDADLLLHLALGYTCVLHDRGTNRPLSKTCYYAVPLVRYVLERRWLGRSPESFFITGRRGGRGMNVGSQWSQLYSKVVDDPTPRGGQLRRRLDYFARYLSTDEVRFTYECQATERDGHTDYQVALARTLATR